MKLEKLVDGIKNLSRRTWKETLLLAAGAGIIVGTYSSHEKDFPPFYVNKIGKSGGICIGLATNIDKDAEFYGVQIGIVNQGRAGNLLQFGVINEIRYSDGRDEHLKYSFLLNYHFGIFEK